MGAKVFEKHFTLDHNLPGPDHWFSEEPTKLKEWVSYIRTSRTMLGDAIVRPTVKEKEMIKLARRCIVASSNISVDEILSSDNIGLKRVRGGLSSLYYENLIGLKAARNIEKNSIIRWGDFK